MTATAAACRGARAGRARRPLSRVAVGNHAAADHREARSRLITRGSWSAGRRARRSRRAKLDEVLKLWAGLGYYARARNLHACARAVVAQHGGIFPDSEDGLLALPGIGAYTAAAIAAIAFDRKATPVDGNIERVVARLFAVEEALAAGQAENPRAGADADARAPARRFRAGHDGSRRHASARPNARPARCAPGTRPAPPASAAIRKRFPRKAPKVEGKIAARRGLCGVARATARCWCARRPAKGLLGGMTEVPTTEWSP